MSPPLLPRSLEAEEDEFLFFRIFLPDIFFLLLLLVFVESLTVCEARALNPRSERFARPPRRRSVDALKSDCGDDSNSVGDGVAELTEEGVIVSFELAEVGE